MKIAVSSDEHHILVEKVLEEIQRRGHEGIYFGPLKNQANRDWTEVTAQAVREITSGRAKEGIVLCWTGTGCTLLANKAVGIRAALCCDAETARGARVWNHANVLGLSMRATSLAVAAEILAVWFETAYSADVWNLARIEDLRHFERACKSPFQS